MKDVEDKILEALKELERWEARKVKVKARLARQDADISEIERINEQITHYRNLLRDMKSKMSSTDITRTIVRTGNQ